MRTLRGTALASLAFSLVVALIVTMQASATHLAAQVYNPMSLSNTTTGPRHSVWYFVGWTNRFSNDINSLDESRDANIWLWGTTDWSSALVLSGSDAPLPERVWADFPCREVGIEWSMAMALNLPSPAGQAAGIAVGHLSNYHYAAGTTVPRGANIGNLSWLTVDYGTLYKNDSCTELHSNGPHIHVEAARKSPVINNDQDPVTGPSNYPYWYWVYH